MRRFFKKTNIDLTSTGLVSLHTMTEDFLGQFIVFYVTAKSGATGTCSFSIGTNSANYNNWLQGASLANTDVGLNQTVTFNSNAPHTKLSNTEEVFLKINSAFGGTFTVDIYGEGFSSGDEPAALTLGETSNTAYRGDRGKTAYDHSQLASGNPHNVTKSDIGLSNVPNIDATSRSNHTGSQAISTVTNLQTVLDGKESTITAGTTAQYWRGDKTWQTLPTTPTKSFSSASRSLNTAFQISTTRDALASYSVDIATSVSLAGGQVGTIYLEYADDSAFTTSVVEVGRFVNGNTGTLVVGLTLNQTNTAPVSGIIPANKYVRLRTQNNTGTPTFTYRSGQEVLL